MKLLSKFRRDESPLHLPTAIGPGVTHSATGGTWAWVEIPARSTDELNTAKIFQLTSEGASDLRRLIPAGAEFQAKVQWTMWTGTDYLRDELTSDLPAGAREYIELGAERIAQQRFPRRQVLLGVRMDQGSSVTAAARKISGLSTVEQDASEALEQTLSKVRAFHDRMATSSFRARPASVQQLAWSLRRDLHGTPEWLPSGDLATAGEMVRLTSAEVLPSVDHVQVLTGRNDQARYLRMVTTSEKGFPTTDLALPGGEWLRNLNIARLDDDSDSVPVEVSIRGRNVSQKESVKILRDALALAKEQDREARQGLAEEAPDAVTDSAKVLRERLREVQQGLGMIEDSVTWVVEAGDLRTLAARTDALIDHYGAMGITCWAPPSIQDLLYKELMLGDTRRVQEFSQFRPWSTLIGAWFHGGSVVGTERGLYLAANIGSTPGPFRNRLSQAQLDGDSITTAFVGQSGSGKSTGVMLSVLGEAVMGEWVLLTDLKGDLAGLPAVAEMFGVPVTRISTSEVSSGSLCPFRYVADHQRAASMAADNLALMIGNRRDDDSETHIRRAANKVAACGNPLKMSTNAIIVALLEDPSPAAQDVGERLIELARDPLARPVAGVPDLTAPQLSTKPGLVYLRFSDLRMPGRKTPQEQWKPGQRLSAMLVQAGFLYATYMASEVKGHAKVVALTEVHLISGYDFGRELISNLARLGRALDINLLLDTQACAELLDIDGLVDQISQVHAFKVKTDAEADAQAKLLGQEPEQRLRDRQQSWGKGECLTRDRAGRVAAVAFDYLATEIETALQTRPERGIQVVPDLELDLDNDASRASA